jgi:hypothetical protein
VSQTSAIPWLPTTSTMEEEEVSVAEQVAAMLHAERQVMILVTGSDNGRVSGFLAELTHAVSDSDTVLRIKAAIDAEELFVLLSGQLNVQSMGLNLMQLAIKVGDRLREKAPSGNFVLLCEAAHDYSNELLESIRQLSNYPINIVLCGRPKLYRRMWRPALSALRQRMNYRLDLNEWHFTGAFKWLIALLALGAAAFFAWQWLSERVEEEPPPKIISDRPKSSVVPVPPVIAVSPPPVAPDPVLAEPAATPSEQDQGLSLVMDPVLRIKPKP